MHSFQFALLLCPTAALAAAERAGGGLSAGRLLSARAPGVSPAPGLSPELPHATPGTGLSLLSEPSGAPEGTQRARVLGGACCPGLALAEGAGGSLRVDSGSRRERGRGRNGMS